MLMLARVTDCTLLMKSLEVENLGVHRTHDDFAFFTVDKLNIH